MAALKYASGEEIQAGDRVRYHGETGRIEFIAKAGDPETRWYVERFGGGCMVQAQGFGRVFLSSSATEEDLEFVGRAIPPG
ncbi:MAG TPA: hypothetical protein VJN43_16605 [Bryobacteraceae bacterium]|nr:hypothetical protein [Bryobacteraceae bacterium]